jgi:hypothetical protein
MCPETFNLWILSWHQQHFGINVWAGIVGDRFVSAPADRQPLPRFPLTKSARAVSTNVLILSALCEMFSMTPFPTYCMASTLSRLESSGVLPVGAPKKPCVYRQWRGKLRSHCECLSRLSSTTPACIFVRIRRSMMRRVEECIQSHGGYFEHLLSMYSFSYLLVNVSGHVLVWLFFLFLLCGNHAQCLSTPFSHALHKPDCSLCRMPFCEIFLSGCRRKSAWYLLWVTTVYSSVIYNLPLLITIHSWDSALSNFVLHHWYITQEWNRKPPCRPAV